MRVLVLGATGLTGRELIAQGSERGHELTALVRSPDTLDGTRTVVGSATDRNALRGAVAGQEAILCALGTRSPRALLGTDLMRASMHALIPAMGQHQVSRLILLSALGVGETRALAPALFKVAFRTLLLQVGRDKASAERDVRASGVDWTVVYPPALTEGPRTGNYRAGETLSLSSSAKISRADLAEFMLAQLDDERYSRKNVLVSY